MKDKVETIWKTILFFVIPSVTMLLTRTFAKVFFELGNSGLGLLTLLGGSMIFIAESYGIYKGLEEAFF